MKKLSLLFIVLLTASFCHAQTTFTKITSASSLEVGANYLIVAHHNDIGVCAMGYQKSNNRHAVAVSESGNAITVTPSTDPTSTTDVFQFTLGGSTNAWTFFDEVTGGYLYAASSSSNQLKTQTVLDANGQWSIVFNTDGTAEVVAQGENERNNMRFNPNNSNNSPLFCCYASTSSIDTRVSFYKEGGTVQPDPEPSNYPTNFTATVNGLDVTLTWNDAVGGQLPHKYLVVGSTGNISIPTDGIPLADSDLVKNVNYGVQSVTFNNLSSNTAYNFAIFPYTNSGAYIDYKSSGNYPTANATTDDISVLLFENFNYDLGVFSAYNVYGEQIWHQATYQGITYANMNGYANGFANANEDWLISPAINKTGFSDVFVEFNTAMKFEWMPLRVMISTNYIGQSNPNNYDWQDITNLFNYSTGNYEWVESGRVSVGIPSNTFYLAFVYTSNTTNAPSWEIDHVSIEALSNSVNYYTINTNVSPAGAGTVTGGGTYAYGTTVNLAANANPGYTFDHWQDGNTQNPRQITVTGNATYTAYFTPTPPTQYTITTEVTPEGAGTVTGGGTYAYGTTVNLAANANLGYTFDRWQDGNTQNSRQITVTGNATYVAYFSEITQEYTITAIADPVQGGAVSGAGIYPAGSTCVLTAMPNEGYVFENWTRGSFVVSTDPSYSFVVNDNVEIVAHFTQDANHFTITAIAAPVEGGAISGSGTYEMGTTCTLNAIAAVGYEFVKWTLNGSQVSTEPSFSFTVTSNAVYTAHFERIINHYTVAASVEPAAAGSVSGTGTYQEGATCTLTATADPTYSFVNWTENGVIVSTNPTYSFTVNSNRSFVAVFSQGQFFTITASASGNGTISPEGDVFVEPGADKTFAMIPNSGCRVGRVIVDGVDIGPVESYTFRSVNSNHSIYVQFSGVGVDENLNANLKVYPNPAKESLVVEGEDMKRVAVFNLLGVQMASQEVNDSHTTINTNGFIIGTYILKVEYTDGKIGYSRFVVAE